MNALTVPMDSRKMLLAVCVVLVMIMVTLIKARAIIELEYAFARIKLLGTCAKNVDLVFQVIQGSYQLFGL